MKFVEFKVGDLFDIHPTKTYKGNNSDLFSPDGKTPVVANNSVNNGIGGYSELPPTEKGGIITFSDTTTADAMFYQPKDFIGYSHVQGMYPRYSGWTPNSLKYFLINFKKYACSAGFDYANKFNRSIAAEFKILLPTIDGKKLDFKYMDKYIKSMEDKYYDNVNKFLKVKHINNIAISKKEYAFLKKNVTYLEFEFDEILEKVRTNKLNYKVKSLPKEPIGKYTLPALTAGINNQGLSCFVPYEGATVLKDCISVSANGANTGAMFYQPKEFTVLQDSYALKTKEKNVSEYAHLYLITAMQNVIKNNYDWTNKAGWERIRKQKMILPVTSNNLPDYDYMDKYIKIQQKFIINKLKTI